MSTRGGHTFIPGLITVSVIGLTISSFRLIGPGWGKLILIARTKLLIKPNVWVTFIIPSGRRRLVIPFRLLDRNFR